MPKTAKEKSQAVKAYVVAVKALADAKEKNTKNPTDVNAKSVQSHSLGVKACLTAVNRERFLTLGKLRVNNVLAALSVLEQCSNRKSYDFKEDEINKAIEVIRTKLQSTLNTFHVALKAPIAATETKDEGFAF